VVCWMHHIIGEMFRSRPLLPGASTMGQVERIFELTGNPKATDVKSWQSEFANAMLENVQAKCRVRLDDLCKGLPRDAKHLMKSLLKLDPNKRLSAELALEHDYVADFHNKSKEIKYPHGSIRIGIDDSVKMKADEYRRQLYHLSSSSSNYSTDDRMAVESRATTVSYDSLLDQDHYQMKINTPIHKL